MSSIYLGNLTVEEMQGRMGIQFPDDLVEHLKQTHQPSAQKVAPGKWHCFDIPFIMVCGGRDLAQKVYDSLSPMAGDIKQAMRVGIQ